MASSQHVKQQSVSLGGDNREPGELIPSHQEINPLYTLSLLLVVRIPTPTHPAPILVRSNHPELCLYRRQCVVLGWGYSQPEGGVQRLQNVGDCNIRVGVWRGVYGDYDECPGEVVRHKFERAQVRGCGSFRKDGGGQRKVLARSDKGG